ncbi:MAG: FAD-dependent oxidoreductase [Burkholderiaceae bacterium]
MNQGSEVIVIGGGLVGASVAWGLARLGAQVTLLDEGDDALRASRGNFGLVWVQSKGLNMPAYARWSLHSADLWPDLAAELLERTGVDVGHERPGGLILDLSEAEHRATVKTLADITAQCQGRCAAYEVLDRGALHELLPDIGPSVAGATYSPADGHANPLYLLRALHTDFARRKGVYRPRQHVREIRTEGARTRVLTEAGSWVADKVVITAGLATTGLAAQVGMTAPIRPLAGQIVVTERTSQFMPMPTNLIRQTREGGLMLGYTVDDFGYDTTARVDRSRDVAHKAVAAVPRIADLRIVRTWAALRIMTADGFPIYDRSREHPGVYVATCHSGVTLAAVHSMVVPEWILSGRAPEEFDSFSTRRFDVQASH